MKKALLLLFSVLLFSSCTTFRSLRVIDGKLMGVLPLKEGIVTYSYMFPMEGVNQDELFRQSRRWIAFHVADPRTAFQVGDFATKDVIGTGGFNSVVVTVKRRIKYVAPDAEYTMTIECYPGFMRTTFSNFKLRGPAMEKAKVANYFGYPIESGTYSSYDDYVVAHFKELDRRIVRQAESLQLFVIENVNPKPPVSNRE